MYQIETSIIIDAPATTVWDVLTDGPHHSQWNPFIRSLEGTIAVGRCLHVVLGPPEKEPMTFRPEVLAAEPARELRWLGRLWGVPRLFDGEHYFLLEPVDSQRTRLVHGERFRGILVWMMRGELDTNVRAGFEAMNVALKAEVEQAPVARRAG